MQGGGQFHPVRTSAGLDDLQQRAHDEMQAAQRANRARRHRARHRGGHLSWLHLGRGKHPEAHAQGSPTATSTAMGSAVATSASAGVSASAGTSSAVGTGVRHDSGSGSDSGHSTSHGY